MTEPKIVIQADCNGIYFYHRKNKEIFIDYKDIVNISHLGLTNRYDKIKITTNYGEFKSMETEQFGVFSTIEQLLKVKEKEER